MTDPTRRQIAMMAEEVGITDHDAAVKLVRRAFEVFRPASAALAADGPAVPEGREPASVAGEPSDEELLELMPETMRDEFSYAAKVCADATGNQVKPGIFRVCLNTAALEYARAALARWGHQPAPPVAAEAGELVAWLHGQDGGIARRAIYSRIADLLSQRHPAPVAVAERLPGPGDCDAEGRCWLHLPDMGTEPLWRLTDPALRSRYHSHWLPAHALPLPSGEVQP